MDTQSRHKQDDKLVDTREIVARVLEKASSRPPLTPDDVEHFQTTRKSSQLKKSAVDLKTP